MYGERPPADAGAADPALRWRKIKHRSRPSPGRRVNGALDGTLDGLLGSRRLLALQLALERFDFFGQRNILAHQRLDLAYSVQDRGVIASAEPAADFRQ